MKFYAQSIAKWDEHENEDQWKYHPETQSFVLADGAGGIGIFSKQWAEKLTQSLRTIDNPEDFLQKIYQLKIEFYKQQEEFLEANPQYFAEKFFEEGSAATLLLAQITNDKIKLFAYGDSGLFIFNPHTNHVKTNLKTEHFTDYPTLINCKDPYIKKECIFFDTHCSNEGDLLILGSDALAKYLYLIYLFESKNKEILENIKNTQTFISEIIHRMQQKQLPSFSEAIQHFQGALQTEENFTMYCKQLYDEGFIEYDDYTLIIVEI
jgi:hypothetical protein